MENMDVVAIVILIIAILVLFYYYLRTNQMAVQKLRSCVPANYSNPMGSMLHKTPEYDDVPVEKDTVEESEEGDSISKKIKIKLSDIDMSGLSTDAFSNKIDAFLDEKSEELIQSWSLATTNDLKNLEDRFDKTSKSVDDLENDFKKFQKSSKAFQKETEKKLEEIDKRIESLEGN